MSNDFFNGRPSVNPRIYAYQDTNPQYDGLLKVGFTNTDTFERVSQQYPTLRPGRLPFRIVLDEPAMRDDGSTFTDHYVHKILRQKNIPNPSGEWFKCNVNVLKSIIISIKNYNEHLSDRIYDFKMRPEQIAAIKKTSNYFQASKKEKKTPRFLWNAKMRFGKSFTAYQLAKKEGWKKILILTFKPAVQNAWEDDLLLHKDFVDWQFVSKNNLNFKKVNFSKPVVCFGSFQDYLGKNKAGGIKSKNEWVHTINWDCVIFDEYHYGAWRDAAKELFEAEDRKEIRFSEGVGIDYFDEQNLPITTRSYLYLSGTPFRAIESGEFIEEQIFNWTYSDEQSAKISWRGDNNPYLSLPKMVMLTYKLPDSIRKIAEKGEFDEFDLNTFFTATGQKNSAKFKYQTEVQKWVNLIKGSFEDELYNNLKMGSKKPPMPFSHYDLLKVLNHTLWFMPSISACHAMKNLLIERQNIFFKDYKIIVAAGNEAGIGVKALEPVKKAMAEPLNSKTITLTCGKLTTGVSIKPWNGIFMLRNTSTPETYFQAAFRVQTPWTVKNFDGKSPNEEIILKDECYVFDFAPDRALKLIADYSCRLNINENNPEAKVAEFIKFLPVISYDGSSMVQVDAEQILDMAMSGTSATLLARRWESALLVNVDNNTLSRLMNNKDAIDALMNIEGFRNLKEDIATIINKSDLIKKIKEKANSKDLTKKEKKELSDEEKEYKNMRQQIQKKLIQFATRIPVFMYLTDYRERTLKDVITQLETDLFNKVTGLRVKDFELLLSLGVFNSGLMNDAIYKFKRYEDSSLRYMGYSIRQDDRVGLFDTVIKKKDLMKEFINNPRPK